VSRALATVDGYRGLARGYSQRMSISLTSPALRAAFDAAESLTIGVEEEVMLLDAETLQLAPRAGELLAALAGDPRFKLEMPAAHVELVTPAEASVPDAIAHLAAARRDLQRAAGTLGLLAIGAGAHPFSAPIGTLNDGPRYDTVRNRYGIMAHVQQICGLHVHVAVGGADATIAVHDMLRAHLPDLAALAAAAPFYAGLDTGLASVRPKISALLPRQGVPPALGDIDGFARELAWGMRAGVMPDARRWWWELRPHPSFGTLEVRVCDAQATTAETAALAATIHALVAALRERCCTGERAAPVPAWRIDENRWSACRDGITGTMADPLTGDCESTRERLRRLLADLLPHAERLGCASALLDAGRPLATDGAAGIHRELVARHGLSGLVMALSGRFAAAGE
jgi:carboxylate-amine ligase